MVALDWPTVTGEQGLAPAFCSLSWSLSGTDRRKTSGASLTARSHRSSLLIAGVRTTPILVSLTAGPVRTRFFSLTFTLVCICQYGGGGEKQREHTLPVSLDLYPDYKGIPGSGLKGLLASCTCHLLSSESTRESSEPRLVGPSSLGLCI